MPDEVAVLRDTEVEARITAADAVRVVRDTLRDLARQPACAPPRVKIPLPGCGLMLSAGRAPGLGSWGLRAYGTEGETDQVTACWDQQGRLAAVVLGRVLGEMRTGAIGAVAVDVMARPDASRLAVLGSGRQAFRQVWAIQAVRRLDRVEVFSPTVEHRERLAALLRDELGVDAQAVADPATAVEAADITVAATNGVGVLDPGWLQDGAHLSTLGPKRRGASEIPVSILDRDPLFVSDSRAQVLDYPGGYFVEEGRVVALGDIVAGGANVWTADRLRVFGSVGLTGTEVALAAHAASVGVRVSPPAHSHDL